MSRTFTALAATWTLAALGWLALMAGEWWFTGPTACDLAPTSSLFGTADWSWIPPGRTCTWHIHDHTHTDTPPAARLAIPQLLAAWGASLLLLRRHTAPARHPDAR